MTRLSAAFGRFFAALALVASALLFLMMAVICSDVLLRNVPLIPTWRGFPATNDLSEAFLYLITLFSAPWLLRQGQHIRVDIMLRMIPEYSAWLCEWAVDALGLACSLLVMWYGWAATVDAWQSGEQFIKAMATPAWWWLAMLPFTFALLGVEFVFRMRRLVQGERGPREEAVSAG